MAVGRGHTRLLSLALLLAATSCAPPRPAARPAIVVGWPQTAITSPQLDRSLVEFVATRHFGYNALDQAQRKRLGADLSRARMGATLDQAVCVRNLLYKLQLDTQRAELSPQQMAEHYATASAGSLEACSAHFQTAPLEVARAVVRHRYDISVALTRRIVELAVSFLGERSSASPEQQLSGFRQHLADPATGRRLSAQSKRDLARFGRSLSAADWGQFVWACQHDMQGRPKEMSLEDAEAGEKQLERHLAACGAAFRTEADLRRAPDEARRSTPDILFDEGTDVYVGHAGPVCWLDMKNQYGTVSCGPASDALVAQLAAKAARYTADWGPGAFVLKYGYCEALSGRLRELLGDEADMVGLLSADSLPPAAKAPAHAGGTDAAGGHGAGGNPDGAEADGDGTAGRAAAERGR